LVGDARHAHSGPENGIAAINVKIFERPGRGAF